MRPDITYLCFVGAVLARPIFDLEARELQPNDLSSSESAIQSAHAVEPAGDVNAWVDEIDEENDTAAAVAEDGPDPRGWEAPHERGEPGKGSPEKGSPEKGSPKKGPPEKGSPKKGPPEKGPKKGGYRRDEDVDDGAVQGQESADR